MQIPRRKQHVAWVGLEEFLSLFRDYQLDRDPRTKNDILFSSSFIVRNSFQWILLHNFELFSSPSREFLFSSLKILKSVSFYIKKIPTL